MRRNLMQKKKGFTLVELIVVIAILAILAGVAIPVYSGYIQKANEAADETLLGAVNSAFAAACLENGKGTREVNASASLTEGKVASVSPYNDAFMRYFSGNENSAFKSFKSIVYNRTDGVFHGTDWAVSYDEDAGTYSVTNSRGETVTVTEANRTALINSNFGGMSINTLMGEVDNVVSQAAGLLDAFEMATPEQLQSLLGTGYTSAMNKLGLDENATAEQLSNAIVLYVADSIGQNSVDTIIESIKNDDTTGMNFGTGAGALASEATLMYALATGFANSEIGKTAIVYDDMGEPLGTAYEYYQTASRNLASADTESGMDALIGVMEMASAIMVTDEWSDYMETDFEADMRGFYGAMQTISANAENIDGVAFASEGLSGAYMSEILSLLYN